MTLAPEQIEWLLDLSPAKKWDKDKSRRALDELFSMARQYRTSRAYFDLVHFIGGFRYYSPFNAMLLGQIAHPFQAGAIQPPSARSPMIFIPRLAAWSLKASSWDTIACLVRGVVQETRA